MTQCYEMASLQLQQAMNTLTTIAELLRKICSFATLGVSVLQPTAGLVGRDVLEFLNILLTVTFKLTKY